MAILEVPFALNHQGSDQSVPRIEVRFASPTSGQSESWFGLADTGAAVTVAPWSLKDDLELTGGRRATFTVANGSSVAGWLVPTIMTVEGTEIRPSDSDQPERHPGGRLTVLAEVFYSKSVSHVLIGRRTFLEFLSPEFEFDRRVINFDTGHPSVRYVPPT